MRDVTGRLRLRLTDVRHRPIAEPVDVVLRHRQRAAVRVARVAGLTTISGLEPGVYALVIDPPSYHPVSQFITIHPDRVTGLRLVCAVDPAKVRPAVPPFLMLPEDARRLLTQSEGVLGFEGLSGADLLAAWDGVRQAGYLNILAKCAATVFATGRSVASYLMALLEVRGDRIFVSVSKAVREETKHSVAEGLFEEVSGVLHHVPAGFSPAGSFKTRDRYGNLQLTFCACADEWRADIDVDDAAGLEHVFQVVRHALTGRPTHPYDVHQLLLQYQHLEPGYDLVV